MAEVHERQSLVQADEARSIPLGSEVAKTEFGQDEGVAMVGGIQESFGTFVASLCWWTPNPPFRKKI